GGLRTSMTAHELLSKNRISIVVLTAAACAPPGVGKNGATSTLPESPAKTKTGTSIVALALVARTRNTVARPAVTRASHRPSALVVALAVASVAPCGLALGVVGSSTIAKVTAAPGSGARVGPRSSKPSVPIPPGGTGSASRSAVKVAAAGGAG